MMKRPDSQALIDESQARWKSALPGVTMRALHGSLTFKIGSSASKPGKFLIRPKVANSSPSFAK
jgi:hypothetical protein